MRQAGQVGRHADGQALEGGRAVHLQQRPGQQVQRSMGRHQQVPRGQRHGQQTVRQHVGQLDAGRGFVERGHLTRRRRRGLAQARQRGTQFGRQLAAGHVAARALQQHGGEPAAIQVQRQRRLPDGSQPAAPGGHIDGRRFGQRAPARLFDADALQQRLPLGHQLGQRQLSAAAVAHTGQLLVEQVQAPRQFTVGTTTARHSQRGGQLARLDALDETRGSRPVAQPCRQGDGAPVQRQPRQQGQAVEPVA
jgi:hypothetical protein